MGTGKAPSVVAILNQINSLLATLYRNALASKLQGAAGRLAGAAPAEPGDPPGAGAAAAAVAFNNAEVSAGYVGKLRQQLEDLAGQCFHAANDPRPHQAGGWGWEAGGGGVCRVLCGGSAVYLLPCIPSLPLPPPLPPHRCWPTSARLRPTSASSPRARWTSCAAASCRVCAPCLDDAAAAGYELARRPGRALAPGPRPCCSPSARTWPGCSRC